MNFADLSKFRYLENTEIPKFAMLIFANLPKFAYLCTIKSSNNGYNRETSALTKAGKSLKCDKLTLVTAYEERELDIDWFIIYVCPAYKWLLN